MMPKPTIGQTDWGDDLNDYLDEQEVKVARVDPGTTGSARQSVKKRAGGLVWVTDPVFNVMDFEAVGDGVADDYQPIMDAYDAAAAAGGGVIYFPPGTYRVATDTMPSGGLRYAFALTDDNITFAGDGVKSIIEFDITAGAIGFLILGAGKTAGASSWSTNEYTDATVYTLTSSYSTGATSVTFATAGDSANFAADDWIFIRTGQTLDASNNQPDAEINQVLTSAAGVLTLRYPLTKPYAQEYYVSGTTGITTTSVTANLAPFGVSKVTDRTIHNLTFRDLRLVCPGIAAFAGGQAVNSTFENLDVYCERSFLSSGNMRFARFTDLTLDMRPDSSARYSIAPSTGSTDYTIDRCVISSVGHVATVHIHEGVANTLMTNSTFTAPNVGATDSNAVSIRARTYNTRIENNSITHGSVGASIYVDDLCAGGGLIDGNRLHNTHTGSEISISSSGWTVGRNDLVANNGVSIFAVGGTRATPFVLSGRLTKDLQQVTLGRVPIGTAYINIRIHVTTAFNSSGTDYIHVGESFGAPNFYSIVENQDASVPGVFVATLKTNYLGNNAYTLTTSYTNGGTEPTTGAALVLVECVPVQRI